MKHLTLQVVTLSLLQIEARQMMAMCFWKNSHHWSSQPSPNTARLKNFFVETAEEQRSGGAGEQSYNVSSLLPNSSSVPTSSPLPHCTSAPLPNSSHVVIRVVYFQTVNWVGFNFCKYHAQAVRIFQQLPKSERFFYEVQPNCYTKFPVWCIDSQHFENVIHELNHCAGIDLRFIVSSPNQIPEIFQPLNLTFSERQQRKQRSRGTVSVNR